MNNVIPTRCPCIGLIASMIVFTMATMNLPAQTPKAMLWRAFMEWNPGVGSLPEDDEIGMLADRRNPDPAWSAAIETCDRVFSAIGEGTIPIDDFYPALRVPLARFFETVLKGGRSELHPRYAVPNRDGNRVSVAVRVDDDETVGYGLIYLIRQDGNWYIEQFSLDLTVFSFQEHSQ